MKINWFSQNIIKAHLIRNNFLSRNNEYIKRFNQDMFNKLFNPVSLNVDFKYFISEKDQFSLSITKFREKEIVSLEN